MGATIIRMHTILRIRQIITIRIPNTRWLLNIEHIGLIVPGVLVGGVSGLAVEEDVGAGLLEEAEHGGAAGASIEPDDGGVGGGVGGVCSCARARARPRACASAGA